MHQLLCIDYPNITAGIRDLNAITYNMLINMIPQFSPQVFIPQDIYHVFSSLNIQSDKTKLQRVKTQFITTNVERGETSYDPAMLTKPMIHQYHEISRSRASEIRHIGIGTNPQRRGWTTPSSSWWPPG